MFVITTKDNKGKVKEKLEIERTDKGKQVKKFRVKNNKLELVSKELAGKKIKRGAGNEF